MKDLLIIGAGGFGRELYQWCKEINAVTPKWSIKGFLDDNLDALKGIDCDIEIVDTIKDWQPSSDEEFALGVADPIIKEKIVTLLESKGAITFLISNKSNWITGQKFIVDGGQSVHCV